MILVEPVQRHQLAVNEHERMCAVVLGHPQKAHNTAHNVQARADRRAVYVHGPHQVTSQHP